MAFAVLKALVSSQSENNEKGCNKDANILPYIKHQKSERIPMIMVVLNSIYCQVNELKRQGKLVGNESHHNRGLRCSHGNKLPIRAHPACAGERKNGEAVLSDSYLTRGLHWH